MTDKNKIKKKLSSQIMGLLDGDIKYKTLLENIPQKIFLKDINSVYVSCNRNLARGLKIKPEEIVGKTDYDFYPKDLSDQYRKDDRNIMQSGQIKEIEEKYTLDGQERFAHTVKAPVKDKEGNVVGIIGIFRDITERKKTERELEETKKQIELILSHTKTGLDIIDSKFNIRYINSGWQKVYGDPKDKKCYEYFMERKKVCSNCGIQKALETKKPIVTEEILVKENNRPIQVTTIPFQDHTGEWLVAEVNVDITERKKIDEKLKLYQEHLEELVEKRTYELEMVNKKFQQDVITCNRMSDELQKSEKRYRNLWDDAPVAYHTLDTQGIITNANKTEAKMLGYKLKDIIGKSIFNFILPEQREEAQRRFQEKLTGKHLSKAERRIYVKNDGSELYMSIDDMLEYDNSDKITGIKTTMVNVTESKEMEKALRESELQYKTTINSMRDAIHVVDADLRIILCNNALQKWLEDMGFKAELSGKILFDVIPFLSDKVRNEYSQVFESGEILTTEEHINFIGKEWVTEVRKIPIEENNKIVRVLTIIRDITKRRKTEETIRHLAYHDILTDLPNRTLFNNRLALELNRAQRNKQKVSVMLMDLDRFKKINDTLGHSLGDQLLKEVGKRLLDIVRSSDTVARMGGDEFILLLPETPLIQDITKIAKKILKEIKKPFFISGKELKITTSIGISVYPTHGMDAEALIKNADIAMYQAKKAGRNKFFKYKLNPK
ncbi:MAG: PAS domain S-box protein [Candidatus Omnitrophota bacterium]